MPLTTCTSTPDCPPHMLQQEGIHVPASRPHCPAPAGSAAIACSLEPTVVQPEAAAPAAAAVALAPASFRNRRRPSAWSSTYMARLLCREWHSVTLSIARDGGRPAGLRLFRQQVLADPEEQQPEPHDPQGDEPFAPAGDVVRRHPRRREGAGEALDLLRRQPRDHDVQADAEEADRDQQSGERNPARIAPGREDEQQDGNQRPECELPAPEDPPEGAADHEPEALHLPG